MSSSAATTTAKGKSPADAAVVQCDVPVMRLAQLQFALQSGTDQAARAELMALVKAHGACDWKNLIQSE